MTRTLVGTSGYAYKEWKGSFYPAKLPAKDMLRFYGEQFHTVEINNTFYRMPNADVLTKWTETVPADFVFILKAPQRITHMMRLKEAADSLNYFFTTAKALGTRRGPTLFQLPPNFKRNDERLTQFLAWVPPDERVAFEFRHVTWYDDEVYALLRKHNVAMCISDVDDDEEIREGSELQTPWVATADFGYARLRRQDYSPEKLREVAAWVNGQKFKDAFVFLKHEDGGKGPRFARDLIKML